MKTISFTRPCQNLRRVVITGLGALTPLGNSISQSWSQALEGRSGIDRITCFDSSSLTVHIAGEVKNFDVSKYISPKEQKKMDRFIHLFLASSIMALEDAGLFSESQSRFDEKLGLRTGIIAGVGLGGLPLIEKYHSDLLNKGPSKVSPFFIPSVIANLAAGQVGIRVGSKAVNYSISSACASGAHAIGESFRYIQRGETDIMIAGGTESVLSALGIAGFTSLKALSKNNENPQAASRPWDENRDGFVISEGAATLILEDYERATKRGATIYAELIGYGTSCDAYHITQPLAEGEGASRAISQAISDAQINKEQIDYINAHGTSTPLGDLTETQAIKKVFGKDLAKKLWISSTKSMTGHTLGAAGAIESAFCALSLRDGKVPPTINLGKPSSDCDLDYVPRQTRSKKLNFVLNNSFGFGGSNASLVFAQTKD